jgi:hypothetical protein
MNHFKLILFLLLLITFQSCSSGNNDASEVESTEVTDYSDRYADGTYCADVEYYNPNTGTRSTYTLNVEVEDNQLTVIHWPNGGWIDDSDFSPEELDSDGSCSFTSDRGYEYTIQITGSECSFTDDVKVRGDAEDDERAVTCPDCGGDKETYNDLCDDCTDKKEHTCSRCGQYDSLMFSTDELCSDCKRKDEEEQESY